MLTLLRLLGDEDTAAAAAAFFELLLLLDDFFQDLNNPPPFLPPPPPRLDMGDVNIMLLTVHMQYRLDIYLYIFAGRESPVDYIPDT